MREMWRLFTVAFLVWAAVVALVGGFLGTLLNCESGEGCGGTASWLPWTWDEDYVFPKAFFLGLFGLGAALAFTWFVWAGARLLALITAAFSLALLAYPFFGGFTAEGRKLFAFGPLLAIAAVATMRSRPPRRIDWST